MDFQNFNFNAAQKQAESASLSKTFIANVFLWMSGALAITALVSYWFASNDALMSLLITQNGLHRSISMLGWIVTLAPLGLVLLMSARFQRMSYSSLTTLFIG